LHIGKQKNTPRERRKHAGFDLYVGFLFAPENGENGFLMRKNKTTILYQYRSLYLKNNFLFDTKGSTQLFFFVYLKEEKNCTIKM
jgi:hypothetical protein